MGGLPINIGMSSHFFVRNALDDFVGCVFKV
jgi:hypothetical protein